MNTRTNATNQRTSSQKAKITASVIAICLIALYAWLFHPGLAHVFSDSLIYTAPSGAYEYSTIHQDNAPTQIEVTFDINDKTAIAQYLQANQERAQMLLDTAKGEQLWTTLTFAKPLPLRELQTLLQETNVKPISYTQVGWDATGQRMGTTIFASASAEFELEEAAKKAISSDPTAPDYNARMAGFMLVDGYITISNESLGRLLKDKRVYLVDTTGYEVQHLTRSNDAVIHLSTPFWNMDWGTMQSNQNVFLPLINN